MSKRPIHPSAEILLLAGDIMPLCAIDQHQDFLKYISDHFKMTYWLPGNHEYFGSDMASFGISFEESIRPNILLLNNQVKQLEDESGPIQLIFSTLWSFIPPDLTEIVAKRMRDFKNIRLNGQFISPADYNQLHQESIDFLTAILSSQKTKIGRKLVVSHHLPSFQNYPKKHQKDPINAGFASNLDDFIQKTTPNAWIFGHHHFNLSPFMIGKTELFTNQLGYIKFKEGSGFDRQAVIELSIQQD